MLQSVGWREEEEGRTAAMQVKKALDLGSCLMKVQLSVYVH